MSDEKESSSTNPTAKSAERRLRGPALEGAEQPTAVDHVSYEASRNPDAELQEEGAPDTLYSDGLDVGEDEEPLAGTHGVGPKGAKG
ncbi:MAG TPA: hypothetical protein VK437_05080 [Steroidobacteraceae bacterium]|nr:hypothetical protein [Steroidobacteraceae bacterium]